MILSRHFGLVVIASLAFAIPAVAHTVSGRLVEAKPAVVEFRYSSGEPMVFAEVTINGPAVGAKSAASAIRQTGRTDGEGRFAFIATEKGTWVAEAIDEEKHKAVFSLDVTEAMTVRRTNERLIEISLFASVLLNVLAGYVMWQGRRTKT